MCGARKKCWKSNKCIRQKERLGTVRGLYVQMLVSILWDVLVGDVEKSLDQRVEQCVPR